MNTGLDLPAVLLLCKIKAEEALISFRCFQASSSEGAGLKESCTELLGTASACFRHIPPPGSYCNCWRVNNISPLLTKHLVYPENGVNHVAAFCKHFSLLEFSWNLFSVAGNILHFCLCMCGCPLWAFCSTILPLPKLLSSLITLPLVPLHLHSFHTLLLMILIHLSVV